MNEDNSLSSAYNRGYSSKTALAAAKSLATIYSDIVPNQTLDSINEIRNIISDSLKDQLLLSIEFNNSSYIESIQILQKSMSEYLKESIYSSNSVFESLKSNLTSFYNLRSISNPALVSLDSALNNELVKYRYKTKRSQDDGENYNFNKLDKDTKDTKPHDSIRETTKDLNSKVEKLDKGFFHGVIAPFSSRFELGQYVSQELISILLNIVATYIFTVGINDAELYAKIMYNSIINRLKH